MQMGMRDRILNMPIYVLRATLPMIQSQCLTSLSCPHFHIHLYKRMRSRLHLQHLMVLSHCLRR